MRKFNKLLPQLRFYITLLLLFLLSFGWFYLSNGLNIQNLLGSKPVPPSQFHAWVAWWDETAGIDAFRKNSKIFTSVSPVWYQLNEEGKLQVIPHKSEAAITESAKVSNVKLIPAIANNFDPERVSKVVNNSDNARKLIEELASIATTANYQGFDIDWEEISPHDQPAFSAFIQQAAEFLHTYNLILTVSVHPQTGQSSDREVARGYDLKALGQNADAVKIMAYDFHNLTSTPGAITPLDELKKVLKYSTSIIPTEKIILGLPTYGYDWPENGQKGKAVSYTEALNTVKKYGGQIDRDANSKSLVGTYNLEGVKHQVWFEDVQTIDKMIEVNRSFGVYNFSFWRLGTEDPKMWTK